jgi:hypothetical protein
MEQATFETESELWVWSSTSGKGNMHFLTIAGDVADDIRAAAYAGPWLDGKRGFGSVKVDVTIGETRWSTSLFPHKDSGGWILPVKAAVRRAELLESGKIIALVIRL